jgi:hypothetical protein
MSHVLFLFLNQPFEIWNCFQFDSALATKKSGLCIHNNIKTVFPNVAFLSFYLWIPPPPSSLRSVWSRSPPIKKRQTEKKFKVFVTKKKHSEFQLLEAGSRIDLNFRNSALARLRGVVIIVSARKRSWVRIPPGYKVLRTLSKHCNAVLCNLICIVIVGHILEWNECQKKLKN